MNGTQQAIQTLSKTTQDLAIQSEISSILDSIVADIEIAHSIEQTINHGRYVKMITARCKLAEKALEEYKALEKSRQKERQEIGALFLQELMELEEKMEYADMDVNGNSNKNENVPSDSTSSIVENSDDIVSNHETDVIQNVTEPQSQIDEDPGISGGDVVAPKFINETATGEGMETSETDTIEKNAASPMAQNSSTGSADEASIESARSKNSEGAAGAVDSVKSSTMSVDIPNEPPAPTSTPDPVSASAQTPVRKTVRKKRESPPSFHHLNANTLMSIFEYMEALDIVNMAQTNARLYTKVNTIFGLGGTIVLSPRGNSNEDDFGAVSDDDFDDVPVVIEDDFDDNDTEDKRIDVSTSGMMGESVSTLASARTSGGDVDVDVDVNASSSDMKNSDSISSFTSDNRATIVSIPSKPPATAAATTGTGTTTKATAKPSTEPTTVKLPPKQRGESKTKPSTETEVKSPVPAPRPISPPPTKNTNNNAYANKTQTQTTATPSKRSSTTFQMSAAVAQSLASKLLPAELSAIIAMRDQLRKKEDELVKADEDVNDLTAQLQGTITVKETLTEKVKELKKSLDSDREISAKITRQTASDQEVIAFLDERVQELEKAVDNFHMERSKANKSIEKVKDASERQVAVLNDMLTYEKQQNADHEKAWKSTKKVLVKEVKHCRAQIVALEAERDGIREENEKLREALVSLGAGNGMPRNGHGIGGSRSESRSRSFDTTLS